MLVLAPHVSGAVPDFELFTNTDDEDISRNAGVLDELVAEGDSALGVFLGNPYVAVKIAPGIIAFLRLGRDRFNDLGGLLKRLLSVKHNARVVACAQVPAGIERTTVQRRDGNPLPVVQLVIDLADEQHCPGAFGVRA